MRLLRHFGVFFRAKNDLGQSFAIAQIDEDDAAVIASHRDPAGQFHLATDIVFAQFVAVMGAVHLVRHSERSRGIPPRYFKVTSTGSLDFAALRSG